MGSQPLEPLRPPRRKPDGLTTSRTSSASTAETRWAHNLLKTPLAPEAETRWAHNLSGYFGNQGGNPLGSQPLEFL